jgi:hypothetical protein
MTIRLRTCVLAVSACAAALTACGPKDDRKGDDTLAVPATVIDTAAAVQGGGATVKAGTPGAGTAKSGAPKETGVDTPITRKLRAEDSARAARDTTR